MGKIVRRIRKFFSINKGYKTKRIVRDKKVDWEKYLKRLNEDLYRESKIFERRMEKKSTKILRGLDVELGGGGHYVFLYFITRLIKPTCVVETGVAAGFTSSAFLNAMTKNGKGHLYSSDFPYLRLENPEEYIGILVDKKLRKKRWSLFIEGDKNNLPKIRNKIEEVDILHYDSDKSYSGRKFAISSLSDKLKEDTIIIYDDILDNNHFYELWKKTDKKCMVIKFNEKYVGILGGIVDKE